MSQVQIYHNPRCSKSRETLDLLEQHGHQPDVILYLTAPLTAETLSDLVKKLGFASARELIRIKDPLYQELYLQHEIDEKVLINAMLENPKLIERPIVVKGNKAALGRPPAQVLEIL